MYVYCHKSVYSYRSTCTPYTTFHNLLLNIYHELTCPALVGYLQLTLSPLQMSFGAFDLLSILFCAICCVHVPLSCIACTQFVHPPSLPWHCWRASVVLLFSYFGSFVIFIGPHRVKNVQRFGNLVEYRYMLAGSRCAAPCPAPAPFFPPLLRAHKMRKSQSRTMNASNSYGSSSNSNCAASISST